MVTAFTTTRSRLKQHHVQSKSKMAERFGSRLLRTSSVNNKSLSISNLHSHHHALDGVTIGFANLTDASAATPITLLGVTSDYNGRQGFSWVGGIGLRVSNSHFNHNGTGRIHSDPGAGV